MRFSSVHELSFERAEQAIHRRIVEAVSLAAHGGIDAMEPEQLAIGAAGIVGGVKRSLQRVLFSRFDIDQPTISIVAGMIDEVDFPFTKWWRIFPPRDGGEVKPAFVRRDVGYTSIPQLDGESKRHIYWS